MRAKEPLLGEVDRLVRGLGKEPANQLKFAPSFLIRHKKIGDLELFLDSTHASARSQRHWKPASERIQGLLEKDYSIEELLYILGWASRLAKYYYPS